MDTLRVSTIRTTPWLLIACAAGVCLALAFLPLSTTGAWASSTDAPRDLHLVVDENGFVERLAWSAPEIGPEPTTYDVNYHFANVDPRFAEVFRSTPDSQLVAAESFGRFVECSAGHDPSNEWVVWVTHPTQDGASEPSNAVSMCFP